MASLLKNTSGQNVTFALVNATTGAGLTGATVAVHFTGDNGTFSVGAGTVTEKGLGQYNYAPVQAESNFTDVGFIFTATNAIPVNVDFHTDIGIAVVDSSGNVSITSNIKKNVSCLIPFPMTDSTNHQLKTGIVFTAGGSQISKDGAAPVNTVNLPVEVGSGLYSITLQAAEVNCNKFVLLLAATGVDAGVIELFTQP